MDVTLHEPHIAYLLYKVAQDDDYFNYTLVEDESDEHRRCLVEAFGTWYVVKGSRVRSFEDEDHARRNF